MRMHPETEFPAGLVREVELNLTINGVSHRLKAPPYAALVDVLRDRLGLTGTKKGCGRGHCGACTVLIDDRPALGCLTFASLAAGRSVRTIEGLGGPDGSLHPLQRAFARHDALQCGYCTPGQIMSAVALLEQGRSLDVHAIREYMSGNLCRCGAYPGILAAIQDAARAMESAT